MINFTNYLQSLIGDKLIVENLALTGTTIEYPIEMLDAGKLPLGGCLYVILYGNVDAQIRPNRKGKVFPRIPERFKGGGMLMPRPFYSRSTPKAAMQHVENLARKVLSSLIISVDGTEQWVGIDQFEKSYAILLDRLQPNRCICCSTVYIDEKMFKGTLVEYEVFNSSIKAICESKGATYLDIAGPLCSEVDAAGWDSVYNKDHFHPNASGYELIATLVSEKVTKAMGSIAK